MKDTEAAKRHHPQYKYVDKMSAKGFIKVSAWVPEKNRDELLDIAQEMREEAEDNGEL